MANRFPVGKIPHRLLGRLLDRHLAADDSVVVGPAVGEDAAAVRWNGRYLVAATDPITFATDSIGHYVVHVNANDVACMGATPAWFLLALLLPPSIAEEEIDGIFTDAARACAEVGAVWCGGHTEITDGLDRPLAVGTMLGSVHGTSIVRTGGARPGDLLWCTKSVPLEATSLLARERPDWVRDRLGDDRWRRCRDLLHEPGISVVAEALAAAGAGATSLHDPTEGGLATGLRELAAAAGVGVEVAAEAIPFDADGRSLCEAAGLDPLGALASGSLLIGAPEGRATEVEAAVAARGVECRRIGRITGETGIVRWDSRSGGEELPEFPVDEITRLLAR